MQSCSVLAPFLHPFSSFSSFLDNQKAEVLHKTEQACLCPFWGADHGELVSFWVPKSQEEPP